MPGEIEVSGTRAPGPAASSLNYARAGEGEPLALIHGIGGELGVWDPVVQRLARAHDVIALDLPGFGGSPPLADGIDPSPVALAAAVASFLAELGVERAHLAGNSLGGWIALELAKRELALSALALCPAGLWPEPLLGAGAVARRSTQRLARRAQPVLPLLLRSRWARRLALNGSVALPDNVPYDALLRMARSYGRAPAYAATNTAMRRTRFLEAQRLMAPVTIAFGERDRLVRQHRLSGAAVPVRYLVLPGCGHIPMWDAPELIARTILQATGAAGERAGR